MKNLVTLFSFFVFSSSLFAQGNIMLMPFEPLMNATWKAEGKWSDGKPFKQEIEYKWSDGEETVEMKTMSYLDSTFKEFGHFSDGVHTWDTTSNSIQFRIQDVNGKVIEGSIMTKQKTIMYNYAIESENGMKTYMTDALIWIKPDKYMYKVGTMKDDEWEAIYLETYFFKKSID
ncbi:MAG: hypothetical protein K9J17_08625 [Flavobacteriales bacterium]|nr:hypothetical protein [Flavobacteriales bacterium]